ncbi:hypothetical protein DOY81_014080, partial [Sarcophaga bullata]
MTVKLKEIDFKKPSTDIVVSKKPLQIKRSNPRSNLDEDFLNRTQNLVHPQWETLDPTPDIFALFGQFDAKFFQSRLKCVTLEWSKRMYSCAGICYSRRNRYGMDITIRLSQPLLTLRPRKDLVETMLHEMIHAYCFVLNIREGNGGHGPNFKKIMYAHSTKTSNRAPGPNDQWWGQHMRNCGGTFMKIKEPEKKKTGRQSKENKENTKKDSTSSGSDLRKFFTPQTKGSSSSKPNTDSTTPSNIRGFGNFNNGFKGSVKTNGGGTMLLNPKTKSSTNISNNAKPTDTSSIAKAFPPSSYPGLSSDPFNVNSTSTAASKSPKNTSSRGAIVPPGGNLRNVMSFKDLSSSGSTRANNSSINRGDWGRGSTLSSAHTTGNTSMKSSSDEEGVDRKHLRDVWLKRFGNTGNSGNVVKDYGSSSNYPNKRNNNDKEHG